MIMAYKTGDIVEVHSTCFFIEYIGKDNRGNSNYEDIVKHYLSDINPLLDKHYRIFTIKEIIRDGYYSFKELGNSYSFQEKFIKGLYNRETDSICSRFEILDYGE